MRIDDLPEPISPLSKNCIDEAAVLFPDKWNIERLTCYSIRYSSKITDSDFHNGTISAGILIIRNPACYAVTFIIALSAKSHLKAAHDITSGTHALPEVGNARIYAYEQ